MRAETKLIKNILLNNFHSSKFKVKYKSSRDQITGGDSIIIETNADVQSVIDLLYKHTKDICIGDKNKISSSSSTGGYILDSNKYIETIAIFIIVSNMPA